MEGFPVSPGVMIDIDRARRLVRGRKPNHRVYLPEIARQLRKGEAATRHPQIRKDKIKLGEPVLTMLVAGIPVLIDGWHRARYAHQRGRTWIAAHLLTEDEARSVSLRAKFFTPTGKRR